MPRIASGRSAHVTIVDPGRRVDGRRLVVGEVERHLSSREISTRPRDRANASPASSTSSIQASTSVAPRSRDQPESAAKSAVPVPSRRRSGRTRTRAIGTPRPCCSAADEAPIGVPPSHASQCCCGTDAMYARTSSIVTAWSGRISLLSTSAASCSASLSTGRISTVNAGPPRTRPGCGRSRTGRARAARPASRARAAGRRGSA